MKPKLNNKSQNPTKNHTHGFMPYPRFPSLGRGLAPEFRFFMFSGLAGIVTIVATLKRI